ncbi:hypothetical protein ES332_A06G104900v1 [Gossypium tomentosum]|uniref:Uncharacterized protein n=1 Tax=Gossypium tomentosum TaxID=34277 RepID=A0A5D2Q2Q4_GOSTO|nr:hypothetical protein ES332_A06G104900v1 [Gossypium tomentosum]
MDFIISIFYLAIELEKIEITSVYLGDVANSLVKQGKADVVGKSIGLLRQRLPAKAQLYFLDDQFFIKSGSYADTCLSRFLFHISYVMFNYGRKGKSTIYVM